VELPVVARELGDHAEDLRVRGIDARRRFELRERLRTLTDAKMQPREVEVNGRALLRPAPRERVDHVPQERARAVGLPGILERFAQTQLERAIVRRERTCLLE